jgi:hypothetical protein
MSFDSTIYGAAARDRGTSKIITTEPHAGKAAQARDCINQAGLRLTCGCTRR